MLQRTMTTVDPTLNTIRGAASGAAGGLGASWIMEKFQGVAYPAFQFLGAASESDPPAPESAARAATRVLVGTRLDGNYAMPGASFVHYAVGAAAGGVYGALAEGRPEVTRWKGTAFGIVSATVVDQILVPLFGFAKPAWRYSLATHAYGYASHVVFGVATEAIRRRIRNLDRDSEGEARAMHDTVALEDAALPLFLGMANGQRSFTPLAAVSFAAAAADNHPAAETHSLLSSPWTAAALGALAMFEYRVDVKPGIPARIAPPALATRMVAGALSGAAVSRKGHTSMAAALGAGGALVGAFLSYRMRMGMARAVRSDWKVGVTESAMSLAGSALIAAVAGMRQRRFR